MRTLFLLVTVRQCDDAVGAFNGRQAVSNDQRTATAHQLIQCGLDVALGLGIEGRSGLVEDQDRRILQNGTGDGQSLALTARQLDAVFADHGVQTIRQRINEFQRVCRFGCSADFFFSVASRLPP